MKKIMLSHGGGGEEMNSLINETIFKIFDNFKAEQRLGNTKFKRQDRI